MRLWVGITDYEWFKLHESKESVEEVNFWRPSSQQVFNVLEWGEPFLFKLHAPRNFIVGGAFSQSSFGSLLALLGPHFRRLTERDRLKRYASESGSIASSQ